MEAYKIADYIVEELKAEDQEWIDGKDAKPLQ